jgi:hypothetical protein
MWYNLENKNSPIGQLIDGIITTSEFMEIMVKRGHKEKKAFETAERIKYDRGNRMPNLKPN